jgi:hypothetical protein
MPAWQAVAERQKQSASKWWLVTQPDHAALAGDLAARLEFAAIPPLSSAVSHAIAVHDAGWAKFDNNAAAATQASRDLPLSFLDIRPSQFLIAWADSIQAAEEIGAVGGIIVSEHFSRLGRSRLASRIDCAEDVHRLQQFLHNESSRQARLRADADESTTQLDMLTDVLQFCDLVSLYLCCGAAEPAEFPQQFGGSRIRVHRDGNAFLFTPALFGRGTNLAVSAREFPGSRASTLAFLLD